MESRRINSRDGVFRNLDWITVILYILLVTCGIFSIYAASYNFDNASIFSFTEFSGKQALWVVLSLVLGLVILLIDSRVYEAYAYPIYGAVLLLLLVTIAAAPNIKGSHSWLVFGPVSLQPAEFGKFATALALAKLFSSYNFSLKTKISNYFRALIIIILPIILILAQRETGSALVYLSLIFVLYREGMSGLVPLSMLFAVVIFVVTVKYTDIAVTGVTTGQLIIFLMVMVTMILMLLFFCKNRRLARDISLGFAGTAVILYILTLCGININWMIYFISVLSAACIYTMFMIFRHRIRKYLITVGFVAGSVLFMFSANFVFNNILGNHQQSRIKVLLGIEENLKGEGYNVNQSLIAIGSGGFTGKGFLNGTQTKLKYVPEQHTDFIFCTVGEEEGFIGSVMVIGLFLFLILRLIYIAERQNSKFGRVYAYCVVSYFIFHLAINIGMVIGLCPVIGIPLPFFSYGGSALWGFTILLFILLRIDASRKERRE